MMQWNIYALERRGGCLVAKFVGNLEAKVDAIRRAVAKVSKQAGIELQVRHAISDREAAPVPAWHVEGTGGGIRRYRFMHAIG